MPAVDTVPGDQAVEAEHTADGGRVVVTLGKPVTLAEGERLEVVIG